MVGRGATAAARGTGEVSLDHVDSPASECVARQEPVEEVLGFLERPDVAEAEQHPDVLRIACGR